MSTSLTPWTGALALATTLLGLTSACGRPIALALAGGSTVRAASDGGHTLTGDIQVFRGFHSQYLPDDRNLIVYLPPDYVSAPTRRYPVLYMQDGQNLFDQATAFLGNEWHLDETAQALIEAGAIQDVIIVGVYNSPSRVFEYTWQRDPSVGDGGGGREYAQLLTLEIKPFVDRTFRTLADRRHTAIMGSSLGGLISFFLGRYDPAVFGDVGMMSPSIWWDDREVLSEVPALPTDLRIWLDMGTREGEGPQDYLDNLADARALEHAIEQRGYQLGRNLGYYEAPGAAHDESAWGKRVYRPLEFFFGTGATLSVPAAPLAPALAGAG